MAGPRRVYHRPGFGVLLVLIAGLTAAQPGRAQIVNTLDGFDPSARGLGGSATVGFDATGGNTDVQRARADATLRAIGDTHALRLLLGYELQRSDGEDDTDDSFVHLRHNRRLSRIVHSLAFAQWQRNPFQRLQRRILLGLGARFDLARGERGHVVFGAAHRAEFERIEDEGGDRTAQRLSTFLDASRALGAGARWTANGFFQPRWSDFGDLRAIASTAIEAPLGGGLSMAVIASLTYDARPPDDVERSDWKVGTRLRYAF